MVSQWTNIQGGLGLNEKQDESEFEVRFLSDGSYSILAKSVDESSVLRAALRADKMKRLIALSDCIKKIRGVSKQKNGLQIFPKVKGVSDEIRLVACAAAAYPGGFPQEEISTELEIADPSRDAYINWDTKESSEYLSYNPSTKQVYVSPAGIEWICNQLKERKVKGFEETG